MELKMYLAYDGNLMIHQVNKDGKHLHFQVDFKRGYGTRESDLDCYEDEADYFKALKNAIADKFKLEKES